jgi:hypothetical protein
MENNGISPSSDSLKHSSNRSSSSGGPSSLTARLLHCIGFGKDRQVTGIGDNPGCPVWLLDPSQILIAESKSGETTQAAGEAIIPRNLSAAPSGTASARALQEHGAPDPLKKMTNLIEKIQDKKNNPQEFIAAVHDENQQLQLDQPSWKMLLRMVGLSREIRSNNVKEEEKNALEQLQEQHKDLLFALLDSPIPETSRHDDYLAQRPIQASHKNILEGFTAPLSNHAAKEKNKEAPPKQASNQHNLKHTYEPKYAYAYGPVGDLPVHACFLLGLKDIGMEIIERFYNDSQAVSLPYIDDTKFWRVRDASPKCIMLCGREFLCSDVCVLV